MYSASDVDTATVGCILLLHVMAPPASVNTKPVVDLLVSVLLAKSESQPASTVVLPFPNNMPVCRDPAMYRNTPLAAVQCSMLSLAMCLAQTPMACEMSGLVQTDKYNKLPTSSLYLQGLGFRQQIKHVQKWLEQSRMQLYSSNTL